MKLSKKLTLSFILSILISIIIISFISNIRINKRFENFLVRERENSFDRIHEEINEHLIKNNFRINEMDLKHYALSEDVVLTIKDNDNKVIYNSGMGMGMGMGHGRMNRMHSIPEGNYVETSYPIMDGASKLGSLNIGYIDNSYLTDSAMIFKSTLTQSFIISGFITILIGIIISVVLSKGLTTPLIIIRNTANDIRSGNLHARARVNSNTTEIVELSESINYLGSTLAKQEEIRKRYASDISHELRTPLTTLKTHIEAIIDGVWEPTNEHLDILMDETSRLAGLVDNLKDSFNEEDYRIYINKTRFNITKEIEDIVTAFEPIYNKSDYKLNTSLENNIEVRMDRDKFKQIMNNLLANSIRYLDKNGEVSIGLKRIKQNVIINVKDNGIGIKESDLSQIFDRFYRVDTSRNKMTGGSGLGLSIVKSIVEAHGGSIKLLSKYGEGTEIEIIFPPD